MIFRSCWSILRSHIAMKSTPHISWLLPTKPKQEMISMGWCKKDVTPLLTHWSTSFLHYVIHIRSVICGLVLCIFVPRQIESTVLGLSISWYTVTSITSDTYIDYWSQAIQSLNVDPSLDMSLILCYSSMPCSDYLKMMGMDKYATLKM